MIIATRKLAPLAPLIRAAYARENNAAYAAYRRSAAIKKVSRVILVLVQGAYTLSPRTSSLRTSKTRSIAFRRQRRKRGDGIGSYERVSTTASGKNSYEVDM